VFAIAAFAGGRGFRTQHLLEEHYAKHGHEFGRITLQEYLHMAQLLRDSRPGKNILEARRTDGGGSKFDTKHGWFVAYDADGTIRTFFVPNEGIRYFERQGRAHGQQ
jgi:pyocin large subunit-like protein